MTTLALSTRIDSTPRPFGRLLGFWRKFLTGIEEARAMAHLYEELSRQSDRELAARGLERQDIPRAVLAAFNGA
jgi:hypothetical protein